MRGGRREQIDVDADDARDHQRERCREAPQRHRAVVAQARERDGHGQHADDQRAGADADQMHGAGQQHVVRDVADQRELRERHDVFAGQPREQRAGGRQRGRQRHETVHRVAAGAQQQRREVGQQPRHQKHHAPQRARQDAIHHTALHRLLRTKD
jgi:hypothetical protein